MPYTTVAISTWARGQRWLSAALLLVASVVTADVSLEGWGEYGHVISAKAAASGLPSRMPRFFRVASDQLGYLCAEPDRWRDERESALDPGLAGAFNPDHAINLERVPPGAFNAPDRFGFLATLQDTQLTSAVGLAPYRALEMFQRLRLQFRLWRAARDRRTRSWIEQRVINDAGLLGHYVTDGANPLHTSIHHHGWLGANLDGFSTDQQIHARFETQFVKGRVKLQDVAALVDRHPRVLADGRTEIFAYFQASHAQLATLYEIDKRAAFGETTTSFENKRFAAERLAFGARMLRDLWWTAWVTSAGSDDPPSK